MAEDLSADIMRTKSTEEVVDKIKSLVRDGVEMEPEVIDRLVGHKAHEARLSMRVDNVQKFVNIEGMQPRSFIWLQW